MSSLSSKFRARFNELFPGLKSPPIISNVRPPPQFRSRVVPDPIHPDFLSKIDPMAPIPEEHLLMNAEGNAVTRRLHPHSAFGKQGFGLVPVPPTIIGPLKTLVTGSFKS
jgi:hypothetical protein